MLEEKHPAPTVSLETALVQSWPVLAGPDQRAPFVRAMRARQVTSGVIRSDLDLDLQAVRTNRAKDAT